MTTMQTVPATDAQQDALARSRRKREELEALAADFVNSSINQLPPPRTQAPRPLLAAVGAVGAVALAAFAWALWPGSSAGPAREAAPAVNEAEQWAKKLEAERERRRAELAHSSQYLEKMAAADSALLKDMTEHASKLAARIEASEVAAARPVQRTADEPTPKALEPAAKNAAPASTPPPATAPAQQAPAESPKQVASAASAQPAPTPAQKGTSAQAAPAQVAEASPSSCRIHVSELSSSGKLTYADVARMKGVRTDDRGNVFTPPVSASGYKSVVFEVHPDGCVDIVRSSLRR